MHMHMCVHAPPSAYMCRSLHVHAVVLCVCMQVPASVGVGCERRGKVHAYPCEVQCGVRCVRTCHW